MTFHKILCPIDFSPGSQYALRTAARIAAASDAELVIASVWYVPPVTYAGDAPVPSEAIQFLIDDTQRGLAQAASDASGLGAVHVTTTMRSGVPWDQLVALLRRDEASDEARDEARDEASDEASDEAFDLVVMGTHGRTGLPRVLLGSVTEQVVRHAPCPVLTVRDRGEAGTFRHVLCPVDFSDSSRRAVELARTMIDPGGAGITLLHVLELPVAYSGEPKIPGFVDDLDRRAAAMLERWAAELRAEVSVPVTARSRIGRPGAQILAAQRGDPSIDLVIVGSHGRTGLPRLLLGSVAEQVIRHASCPVLVARSRAAEENAAAS